MNRFTKAVAVLVVLVSGAAMMRAQEKEAPKVPAPSGPPERAVYRLDFVVAELEDGKKINSRAYSMWVHQLRGPGNVNVSTRVPVPTGGSSGNMQFQYMDVGLSLEYRVIEEGTFVIVEGNTRIESFATGGSEPQPNSLNMPITRRVSINGQAAVTPGKPTVIGSVDDVNSKKRYEVQVTATKIK